MAKTTDYLYWRGDVPFSISPLNEADEYLICMIGMLDLRPVVPEDGTYIPLHRMIELYLSGGGDLDLGALTSAQIAPIVLSLQNAPRYRDVMLSGFRLTISEENNEQFSAVTVRVPGGKHYITFRGTDDSLVGWKENFLLTVNSPVRAQTDAAEYLRWAAQNYPGQLIVAGHSKGGNMAVYAASTVEEEVQSRIEKVISLDGPGFQSDFLESPGYRRIRGKIRSLVPQHSMVGCLLFQDAECAVVKSDALFFGAHDGFNWEVDPGGTFQRLKDRSAASKAFAQAMQAVLDSMNIDDRKNFIEQLFGTLSAGGATTVSDITDRKVWEVMRTVISLTKEPEVKKMALDAMEEVTKDYLAEKGKALTKLRLPGLFKSRQKEEEGEEKEIVPTEHGWYDE